MIFKVMFKTDEIVLKWMSLDHTKYVNIGLGNGFVPSDSVYGYMVSWVSR